LSVILNVVKDLKMKNGVKIVCMFEILQSRCSFRMTNCLPVFVREAVEFVK